MSSDYNLIWVIRYSLIDSQSINQFEYNIESYAEIILIFIYQLMLNLKQNVKFTFREKKSYIRST